MRRPRRRAFLLSRSALDALVLLTIGTVGVIGLLCWPEYALTVIGISLALILLFVTVR
jgi:hypothetical protein